MAYASQGGISSLTFLPWPGFARSCCSNEANKQVIGAESTVTGVGICFGGSTVYFGFEVEDLPDTGTEKAEFV